MDILVEALYRMIGLWVSKSKIMKFRNLIQTKIEIKEFKFC